MHTWWPNAGDILYLHNAAQHQTLVPLWGYDYTPHFWMDGNVDLGSDPSDYTSMMEARKDVLSPGCINLNWRASDSTVVACVDVQEPLDPAGDYRLKVCITEDDYYFAGGNGHNTHNQALRRMLPDTDGIVIDAAPGPQCFEVPVEIPAYWNPDNLNITAFLQDEVSWRVWQTSTGDMDSLQGRLIIDPHLSSVDILDGPFTVAMNIEPSQSPVKGVDVLVEFDESVVRLDSIMAGTWITDSGLSHFFYDYTADDNTIIHFSTAFLDSARGDDGHLVTCHFTPLAVGDTELTFVETSLRNMVNAELGYATSMVDSIQVYSDLTTTEEPVEQFDSLRFLGNTPNPFNPSTMLRYQLPAAGEWTVTIFDVEGRRVRELLQGRQEAGMHELRWDGRGDDGQSAGSGLYLVQVSGQGTNVSGKLLLLK